MYTAGPRLETMISCRRPPPFTLRSRGRRELHALRFVPEHPVEQREPVAEQPRRQEVAANVLLARERDLPGSRRIREDLETRFGALRRGRDEPAGLTVRDLVDDAADVAGDGRARLPERLADRQPEPFPDRLLDYGGRMHLERVHLDRADVVEVREDVDVGIGRGVRHGLVVEVPPLRVV